MNASIPLPTNTKLINDDLPGCSCLKFQNAKANNQLHNHESLLKLPTHRNENDIVNTEQDI
jgi:hypothetical protein